MYKELTDEEIEELKQEQEALTSEIKRLSKQLSKIEKQLIAKSIDDNLEKVSLATKASKDFAISTLTSFKNKYLSKTK